MPIPEIVFSSLVGQITAARAETIGSPNARQSMQDRSELTPITTAGKIELLVALVADGMGGGVEGETAAELTKTQLLKHLSESSLTDVEILLRKAVEETQQDVISDENIKNIPSSMLVGSTLAVAVIHEDKLYVANVGDSRVYLIRNEKVYQLTEDHTWGNEMLKAGRVDKEELKRLSRSGDLSQYMGFRKSIKVDQVIHGPNGEVDVLKLLPGDGVMVCSDGLIKERPNHPDPFVYDHEILNTFVTEPPQAIVNMLIAFAKGRRVDDNVSVIAIKVSGKTQPFNLLKHKFLSGTKQASTSRSAFLGILGIFSVLVIGAVFFAIATSGGGDSTITPTAVSRAQVTEVHQRSEVNVIDASLAQFSQPNQNALNIKAGDKLSSGDESRLWTTSNGSAVLELAEGSRLFVNQSTRLFLTQLADPAKGVTETILILEKGSIYFSGHTANFRILAGETQWFALNQGSKMGVSFDGTGSFQVDCFEGLCQVGDLIQTVTLNAGQGGGYENNLLGLSRDGQYAEWITMAGADIPSPTFTPSPTITITPSPTPSPSITPTRRYISPIPPPQENNPPPPADNPGSGTG